ESDALLGFLREMEFNTLTRRIAEKLGVELPPMPERPRSTRPSNGAAAPARKADGKDIAPGGAGTPAAVVAYADEASLTPAIDRSKYQTVTTLARLEHWIEEARNVGRFGFDTETTSRDPMEADLVGFSMAIAPGEACYVPLDHKPASDAFDFGDGNGLEQISLREALAAVKPLLEDPSVLKIGHNIKYDWLLLSRYGVEIQAFDDTLLMSYALDGGRGNHGMDELSERHLKHAAMPFAKAMEHAPGSKGNGRTFANVPVDKATEYAAEDAEVTLRLWTRFK